MFSAKTYLSISFVLYGIDGNDIYLIKYITQSNNQRHFSLSHLFILIDIIIQIYIFNINNT